MGFTDFKMGSYMYVRHDGVDLSHSFCYILLACTQKQHKVLLMG